MVLIVSLQGSGGSHVTETGSAHSSSSGKTPRRPGGQVADGDRIKTLETVGGVYKMFQNLCTCARASLCRRRRRPWKRMRS